MHKILIDVLESCLVFVDYCDVFSSCLHSFWRHPFTAEDTLMSKWCNAMLHLSRSDDDKLIYILDSLRVSTFKFSLTCNFFNSDLLVYECNAWLTNKFALSQEFALSIYISFPQYWLKLIVLWFPKSLKNFSAFMKRALLYVYVANIFIFHVSYFLLGKVYCNHQRQLQISSHMHMHDVHAFSAHTTDEYFYIIVIFPAKHVGICWFMTH